MKTQDISQSHVQVGQTAALLPIERRLVVGLSGVMSLRMVGLFMLLPIVALYAEGKVGATPLTIGLAVGIYGLSQAFMQWPMGIWSDRIGRRTVVILGLCLFALGSVLSAISLNIEWLLLGRFLQGAGAVSGVLMAWLGDGVKPDSRTRAMAILGITIGMSFMLALLLGPALATVWEVSGVFWFVAGLALLAMLWTWQLPHTVLQESVGSAVQTLSLQRLIVPFAGIFALHLAMTLMFVKLPFILRDTLQLSQSSHWTIYSGGLLLSLLGFVPMLRLTEKHNVAGTLQSLSGVLIVLGLTYLLCMANSSTTVVIGLAIFFAGFNFLESYWPSWVSQQTSVYNRGRIMGLYGAMQFMGAFAGGMLGGLLLR